MRKVIGGGVDVTAVGTGGGCVQPAIKRKTQRRKEAKRQRISLIPLRLCAFASKFIFSFIALAKQ
jgi:hypothetical protein